MRRKIFYQTIILLAVVLAALNCGIRVTLASTTGIVSGFVMDSSTGAKLGGVNIAIKGTGLTTVTDANGFYVIANVAPGTYIVTAELVGYEIGEISDVQVVMDATSRVDFKLTQEITEEKAVEVTISRPQIRADVTPTLYMVTSKQEKQIKSQPNYLYQIPGIISTQPGIIIDPDGRPHIRGGRDNEIGYMLEGIPVTEPVSNVFATNTVTVGMDKLQVYTGGYRAEYGNATAGVLNEIKKTGSEYPGSSLDFAGGNQRFAGLYAETGGSKERGLDYYVGAYLWKTDFERLSFSQVKSGDIIGKFVMPRGEKDKLTLLVNHGRARYNLLDYHEITDLSQPVAREIDHNHQSYELLGLTWAHNFSDKSFMTIRPYILNSRAILDALSPTMSAYLNWYSHQRGLQFEYTNQLNAQHLIKAGISGVYSNNYYRAYVPKWPGVPETWGDYDYTSDVNTFQLGMFAQDQIKINDKWTTDIGIRFDRMKFNTINGPDLKPSQTSPRFGLNYSPETKSVWRFSWGKFIQYPMAYVVDREYADPQWEEYRRSYNPLKPQRADNWDFGYERQISENMMGRITYFSRKYKDLIVAGRDLEAPGRPRTYFNGGSAESKGIELYLNRRLSKNLEGWLSYTYMEAEGDASDFRSYPGDKMWLDWDQRHTLVAVLTKRSGKWSHSLMMDYGSGFADSVFGLDPSIQGHGKSHLIFNYNVSRKLPAGCVIGDEIYLSVFNIFNTPRAVKKNLYPGDTDEDPPYVEITGWVPPRFFNLGIVKRF